MSIHLDGCLATFSKSWIREVYSNEPHNYVCHSNTNHLIWKHFYDESHWFCASWGVVMLPFTFKKDDPPLATIGFANKISEEKKGINPQTIRVQNDNNSSTMMNEPTLQKSRRYTRRFCPLKELYAWEEVRANYISIKPTKKKYFIQQMSHTKKKTWAETKRKKPMGDKCERMNTNYNQRFDSFQLNRVSPVSNVGAICQYWRHRDESAAKVYRDNLMCSCPSHR